MGWLTCAKCGCSITAEMKKGKYVDDIAKAIRTSGQDAERSRIEALRQLDRYPTTDEHGEPGGFRRVDFQCGRAR